MKSITYAALALLITTPALAADGKKNWNFKDGTVDERWSLVSPDYALCDAGLNQSPIDLGQANARGKIALSVNFGEAAGKMAIGEEKVQVDFTPGQGKGMNSGGMAFNLLQVHFHTPSEHAVNGKRYPLVAHFVHATAEGKLGVLGVMFKEGEENNGLTELLSAFDKGNDAEVNLDLDTRLPEDIDVFRYMGSLTTPPCSEGVNWHVADTPVEASSAQIAKLRGALGPSARSLQPLGSRLLVAPE